MLLTYTHSRSLGSAGKAARYTPLAWSAVLAWAKNLPHGPRSSKTSLGGFFRFLSWFVACSGLAWLFERFNEPPNSRNGPTNSLILSSRVRKNILYLALNMSNGKAQINFSSYGILSICKNHALECLEAIVF